MTEAIEELEKSVADAPAHQDFDEFRWSLAKAFLCDSKRRFQELRERLIASSVDALRERRWRDHPDLAGIQAIRSRARPLFDAIRENENWREHAPLPRSRAALDPSDELDACTSDRRYSIEARPQPPRVFVLQRAGPPTGAIAGCATGWESWER